MQWLKNKCFTHQYYKITEDGSQVSMMENVPHSYVLHIYNDGHVRYHFIKLGQSYKLDYSTTILGLSVTYNNVPYLLPTESFAIQKNEFTPTIQKWLCKHYLHISPQENGKFTWIDQDAHITVCENLRV
jgi:hypothetical protein